MKFHPGQYPRSYERTNVPNALVNVRSVREQLPFEILSSPLFILRCERSDTREQGGNTGTLLRLVVKKLLSLVASSANSVRLEMVSLAFVDLSKRFLSLSLSLSVPLIVSRVQTHRGRCDSWCRVSSRNSSRCFCSQRSAEGQEGEGGRMGNFIEKLSSEAQLKVKFLRHSSKVRLIV